MNGGKKKSKEDNWKSGEEFVEIKYKKLIFNPSTTLRYKKKRSYITN